MCIYCSENHEIPISKSVLVVAFSFTTHFPTIVPQMWFLQTVLTSNSIDAATTIATRLTSRRLFLYDSYEEEIDNYSSFGYCICYILYILRHRRNDVDSIIIEELAYYCFSSHFFTHLIALICSLSLNLESSFVSFPSRTAS